MEPENIHPAHQRHLGGASKVWFEMFFAAMLCSNQKYNVDSITVTAVIDSFQFCLPCRLRILEYGEYVSQNFSPSLRKRDLAIKLKQPCTFRIEWAKVQIDTTNTKDP